MKEITRNRTIRPSTRLEKSKNYKIDTKKVSCGDILLVNITHDTKPFCKSYKFNGSDVSLKDSINFSVTDYGTSIDISWNGAFPIGDVTSKSEMSGAVKKTLPKKVFEKVVPKPISVDTIISFDPISSIDTKVLILGTMPGDIFLAVGEYYGYPRNRFWKIISLIAVKDLPQNYAYKKVPLLKAKIGIWDVAHKANRKGSLDSAIENEIPNGLNDFIAKHKKIEVIGFNGKKSEELFNKYFDRIDGLKYISLPSSSPANTAIDFDINCKQWSQLLIK